MNIKMNASDHATKGAITATARGQIVWRGLGKDVAQGLKLGPDTLHVHADDAPVIKQAFEKAGHAIHVLK